MTNGTDPTIYNTLNAEIQKSFRNDGGFALDVKAVVPPGISILFGQSGAGKTTLLECIAGLSAPDAGRITLGERVLFDSAQAICIPPQDRRIGYVFQSLALFPHLSVEQNVSYGLHHLKKPEQTELVNQVLKSFHIERLARRTPDRISGGERQRTALARSLVIKPSLLLLDEPLSALDEATKQGIMDDLLRWNESHPIPVIYVTHSYHEAFAMGKQMIVLAAGKILVTGPPEKAFEEFKKAVI